MECELCHEQDSPASIYVMDYKTHTYCKPCYRRESASFYAQFNNRGEKAQHVLSKAYLKLEKKLRRSMRT
jgi:hypothetical protein